MENKYGIVGVAHVGLPTNDLQKTVEFYKSLGFEEIMQTYNEKAGEKVAFLQIKNYCSLSFIQLCEDERGSDYSGKRKNFCKDTVESSHAEQTISSCIGRTDIIWIYIIW